MAKKSGKTATKQKPTKFVKTTKSVIKKSASRPTNAVAPKSVSRHAKLPSAWQLTKTAAQTVWQHKRFFTVLILVYGLLNLLLVQGFAAGGTDIASLKNSLDQVFMGHFGALAASLGGLSLLVSSAGTSTTPTAGTYQLFLVLITSLAIIWALRQLMAGAQPRVRDTYYRGPYALVPFILVLLVIGLQLIPLLVGSTIYSQVIGGGIAVHVGERLFWLFIYTLLALLSLYMLSSSLIALYVVTLPNMTPMKALRSARELVRSRRWMVMGRIFCLPIILLSAAAIIGTPIIVWLTPLAPLVFFILTMFALVAVHAYMYTLYRELLNE